MPLGVDSECRGISLTHASGRLVTCRVPYTLFPSFSGASGCHRQVSRPLRSVYVADAIEHRTGFEPAKYLLGRQAGSQLPNRYIINLVELSGFHSGNEPSPRIRIELQMSCVRVLRVTQPHAVVNMRHLGTRASLKTVAGLDERHLSARVSQMTVT